MSVLNTKTILLQPARMDLLNFGIQTW